jgi:hypothetical protein
MLFCSQYRVLEHPQSKFHPYVRNRVSHPYKPIRKMIHIICRDGSVGIVIRLRTGRPKNRGSILAEKRDFLFSTVYRQALGAHPVSYPVSSAGSFPGLMRLKRKAGRSAPFTTEVKNAWSYTSTPPYVFIT